MSPAVSRRRAVVLASLSLISALPAIAPALARAGGGAPAVMRVQAPAPAKPAAAAPRIQPPQRPVQAARPVHQHVRPQYGVYQQGASVQRLGNRPGTIPGYVRLPATFAPQAPWPQAHISPQRNAAFGGAAFVAPQIIYAPAVADTAAEPPLELTHGEPPLDAYALPCTAPLVIHIGTVPAARAANGVRVIHGQQSACATPQSVTYQGPKIVQVGPEARTHRQPASGRRAQTGFKVVQTRF